MRKSDPKPALKPDPLFMITQPDELQRRFGVPSEPSVVKVRDHIDDDYRALIKASPFLVMATAGPHGLDCSPRGDPAGFVDVPDSKTVIIPERRGNNRIDGLKNLLHDPRIGLIFLIPGVGETIRVSGTASISYAPDLLGRFMQGGTLPRVAIVVKVETVFFQCARAVMRADLWNPAQQRERDALPSAGQLLRNATAGQFDGEAYDRALSERLAATLYRS